MRSAVLVMGLVVSAAASAQTDAGFEVDAGQAVVTQVVVVEAVPSQVQQSQVGPPVVPGASTAQKPEGSVVFSAAPGRGATIKSVDGNYSLTLRGRVQLRDTFTHDAKDLNELEIRTVRLVLQGNVLSPDLKYLVQFAFGGNDFETGSSSPIFDAFVEYTRWRELNIRVGQFFVPFDRARTTREFALQFVDRQVSVRELSLDRDVGVMLSSNDLFGLGSRLGYNFFIGAGDGRNRFIAQTPGPLTVLRLTARPFGAFDDDQEGDLTRDPKPRLEVSVAGAYNVHSYRSQSTLGNTYTYGTHDYLHAAADVVFKVAGFSLFSEFVWRKATTPGLGYIDGPLGTPATREWSRNGVGYFVQAGYLIGTYVEVVARWDQLYALDTTDPTLIAAANTTGRQLGGGVNVYLNGHAFKIQADYFAIWGPTATVARHQLRLQLDASF